MPHGDNAAALPGCHRGRRVEFHHRARHRHSLGRRQADPQHRTPRQRQPPRRFHPYIGLDTEIDRCAISKGWTLVVGQVDRAFQKAVLLQGKVPDSADLIVLMLRCRSWKRKTKGVLTLC